MQRTLTPLKEGQYLYPLFNVFFRLHIVLLSLPYGSSYDKKPDSAGAARKTLCKRGKPRSGSLSQLVREAAS